MPALVAGIHVFLALQQKQGVDGRDKPTSVRAVFRGAGPARDRNQPEEPRQQALSSRRRYGIEIVTVDRQCGSSRGSLWRLACGPDAAVAGRLSAENRRLCASD